MIKNHIIFEPFSNWRFCITRAEGSYIWDEKGNKFIDFTSGWNVANLGWNHVEIKEAIIKQLEKNAYAPMWTMDPIQEAYASALVASLPKELCAIGRATGGTEANEEAIKTAKAYTGRNKILSFRNTYHGQSQVTLALGFIARGEEMKEPAYQNFIKLDFPNVTSNTKTEKQTLEDFSVALEQVLSTREIAAIVSEAGIVTGAGSVLVGPDNYLKTIRDLTKKYETLLILDEVGTGFSRCGKLYGMHLDNVRHDIVTFAKGATNGSAVLGTMVTTEEIAEKTLERTNLISTFGWTPVACAAALKTLEIHNRDKVWLKAESDSKYLQEQLMIKTKNLSHIESIAGKGMVIGIHFHKETKRGLVNEVVQNAQQKGLHIVSDKQSTLQLMPPLTIAREDLDQGLEILWSVLKSSI